MPPDYKFSFSGSALPFASEEAAFNPSQDAITVSTDGTASVYVSLPPNTAHPNYYYIDGTYSAPRALVQYTSNTQSVVELVTLHDVMRVVGRSLTPTPRMYASSRHGPVVTQESLLRSNAMPGVSCLPGVYFTHS